MPTVLESTIHTAVQELSEGTVMSLVGLVTADAAHCNVLHIGLHLANDKPQVLWADEVDNGNSGWTVRSVWHECFDAAGASLAIIKHWHKGRVPW